MTCRACGRDNLPGGVRCVYCGTHFSSDLEFELDAPATVERLPQIESPVVHPPTSSAPNRARGGFVGAILLIAFKGKFLLSLLKLGPFLTTFGSMFVFIAAESRIFGWKLAAGFAFVIFIHEMGHVVMNWKNGLKCSAPMFIPFFGALIMVKSFRDNPRIESESGAGGPAAGLLASIVCLAIGLITQERFWFTLATLSFSINLLNLIPVWQLDGAHIVSPLSPGHWDFILIALLLIVIKAPVGILWGLLIILFVLRIARTSWTGYSLVAPVVRTRMTLVFLVLCLTLAYGTAISTSAGARLTGSASSSAITGDSDQQPGRVRPSRSVVNPPRSTRFSADSEQSVGGSLIQLIVLLAVGAFAIAVVVLVISGWFITAALIARTSGEPFGHAGFALAGTMTIISILAAGLRIGLSLDWLGEGFATSLGGAVLAALLFAGYQASHVSRQIFRPMRHRLTWRCLAWAAAGALGVAYWLDNLWVVAGVAIIAGVFYARRQWLIPAVIARAYERLGNIDQAIAFRQRALSMGPEPEAKADLHLELARSYLTLGRGENALRSLDDQGAGRSRHEEHLILGDVLRAQALIRLDRFDEAIRICEQLLSATSEANRLGPVRLLLVRGILTEMALYRDWPDEALAQSNAVLVSVPASAGGFLRQLVATTRQIRAAAMAVSKRTEDARSEIEKALRWDHSLAAEANAALIRARIQIQEGDTAGALKSVEMALARLPGSLEARYWQGVALNDAGSQDGRDTLKDLSEVFPNEHWGKMAARGLEPVAA